MSAIILDLDNCIADDSWRIPKINWQIEDPFVRYHDYHCLSAFDVSGNHDLYVGSPHEIIIFTARPIIYRPMTQEWLKRHGVSYSVLMMRDMEDHRHSVELKKMQLEVLIENSDLTIEAIAGAYDDRPEVISMYKGMGIESAQVRSIHDVCAYTKPQEKK